MRKDWAGEIPPQIIALKKIKQAIIVEGTYDKIKLSSFLDANIVTCNGFDIFQNKEKQEYIKKLAAECGVIILTDSDRAGFLIRNFIKGIVHEGELLQAFIPDTPGKERRKRKPSKEGLLGVEGIEKDIIIAALENAGCSGAVKEITPVSKTDFYLDGITGGVGSHEKRKKLAAKIGAPARISAKELLSAVNAFGGMDIYKEILEEIENEAL